MENKYKTSKYWLDRESLEKDAIKKYIAQDQRAIYSLGQHYDLMLNNINNLIDAEVSRLASRNNVGLELARQQVSKMDVSAYQAKAKEIVQKASQMRKEGHHVSYGDYPEDINKELRIYNATMRINRLELLKANMALEVARANMAVTSDTQTTLINRYVSEVKRQAGILGINAKNDQLLNNVAIQGVVNADLNGATWSTRLWANQVGIRANLEQVLSTGLAHFDSKRMHRLMQSTVNNWKYVASRLLNTEISRVLVAAQWSSIKKAGFDYVKWIAEPKACSICSGIAHTPSKEGTGVFKIDKVPSIPAQTHPNCRCSISAYWVEEDKETSEHGNGLRRVGTNKVDESYIHSNEFKNKFDSLSDNHKLNQQIRKYAIAMLTHRQGTDGEDSYIFDQTGKVVAKSFGAEGKLEVGFSKKKLQEIDQNYEAGTLIGMHNHPTNIPPTGSDFFVANVRKYDYGLVITHDGRIFKYSLKGDPRLPMILDKTIENVRRSHYNWNEDRVFLNAINRLKEMGYKCVEIK